MKVTLLAENIQKKISVVNHAISSRQQLPILGNVLLETTGETLKISSTDLEIGIEVTIHAQIEEEGATTVLAKLFTDLITILPQEKITLETIDNSLHVIGKKSKSILQTISREEFPLLYDEKGKHAFKVKTVELKKYISMVAFATSVETTRPALSGVLLTPSTDGFVFVATDGYRLSLKKTTEKKLEEIEKPMLIPVRVLKEVLSFSDNGEVSMYISKKNNQIIFMQDDCMVVGRLIGAQFPDYEKILPTDVASTISFEREDLLKAVKTCALFARDSANIITLSLQKEKTIVSSNTPSLGENVVEVESTLTGEENQIAFNGRYLQDALTNIVTEQMTFEMTGPLNPGVFKITGDTSFLHLIMPIRV